MGALDNPRATVGQFAYKQARGRRRQDVEMLAALSMGSAATQGASVMKIRCYVFTFAFVGCFAAVISSPAFAQETIKIGELNSYKAQPAFLDPYKKGWEMAIEEINAKGGVLGKKLEVVSRDDGANPG